jgi:hypothetical protein
MGVAVESELTAIAALIDLELPAHEFVTGHLSPKVRHKDA